MEPTKPFDQAAPSTQDWWRCPGILYFLGVGEPPIAIKIGMLAITGDLDKTAAMNRRLASIQSSNHELVYVLGAIHFTEGPHPTKDAEDLERQLHKKFDSLARFTAGTRGAEWFNTSDELIAEIKASAQKPEVLGLDRTAAQLVRARHGDA